ncbi:MAG: MerC domain-containing protein [Planctomycetota bacterium]
MNSRRPPTPGAAAVSAIDVYAASIAMLCLAHCLALPLLISSLSLAVPFAESEVVHKVLVLIAAPATFLAIYADAGTAGRRVFMGAALFGLALLFAGAFLPALEAHEQTVTVAGSVILAAAHIWRAFDVRAKRARPVGAT